MRFFMISDLHFGIGLSVEKAKGQFVTLCRKIRSDFSLEDTILFIIMGDIIFRGDTAAFSDARICLDCIREELGGRTVKFEFLPGNHDLTNGNFDDFDKFTAEYGSSNPFGRTGVYSKTYDDVNFIFADSNLSRDHRLPGKLDIEAIRTEAKKTLNLLFCHHGFTHCYGDDHDTIENGYMVLKDLESMGIQFAFHGHTHRADTTLLKEGIVEIGCGTMFSDVSVMDGIPNQFTVGYIREKKLVMVERFIVSKDGGNGFPRETLYPEQHTFADPNNIDKRIYNAVPNYIHRKALPHASIIDGGAERFLFKGKKTSLLNALLESEKVLFLGDAGQGKSIEMENLAHELSQTSYFPYLYRLRNYTNSEIRDLLPEGYNEIAPHYRVLLFDGYDELHVENRRIFEKKLNSYVENCSGEKIIISSRSNFCKSEMDDESRTFPGFKIYDLSELSLEDINFYLNAQGIETKRFLKEARNVGIYDLLTNAFYLTKISELYKKKWLLPKRAELMDKLIEACFETDDAKFTNDLDNNYLEFMKLLEQVSFAMQLMQQSKINDRTEYQALFDKNERDLIMHSGMLVKDGDSWRFLHNNFREYLTAKYLSKIGQEEVISYISSGNGINPSWVNTLGYLTSMVLQWDLVSWVATNAPNVLVKFEPDRIDQPTRFDRYDVFTRIFCYYEAKRLWFSDELCDEEELAYFSESDTALTFLLGRISRPVHAISQYTAVNLLRHYRSLFGRGDEVRACLLDYCIGLPETRKDVCRLAIKALYQLKICSPEITGQLITMFKHSNVDFVRAGLYEYLVETKEHNQYVEFFLVGIRYIVRGINQDYERVGDELFSLVEGMKRMSTVESISAVLEWFASETKPSFYGDEEVFTLLSRRAGQLYNEGAHGLYEILLSCCKKSLREFDLKTSKDCVDFFVVTDTAEIAILTLITDECFMNNMSYISEMLYLHPEFVKYIVSAYSENRFNNHDVFKSIVVRHIEDENLYNRCSEVILGRSGVQLTKLMPRINYETESYKSTLKYFNSLFSREKAESMLLELVKTIGHPHLLVKDLLDFSSGIPWYSPLKNLKHAIYIWANKETQVADFFTNLDFNRFTIIECKKILSGKSGISVSDEQKEHIRNIIIHNLDQDVLKTEVRHLSGKVCLTLYVNSLIFLSQYFDFSLNEDKLLDMTLIPEQCFGDSKTNRKYEYLKEQVTMDKLKTRIAQNFSIQNLDSVILQDHIEFCSENSYDAATSKALDLCYSENTDSWLRTASLKYLYKLYGDDYLCKRILPTATGGFLLEVTTLCKGIPSNIVCQILEGEYTRVPSNELMARLIFHGSTIGVEAYVKEITENLRVPERNLLPDSPTRLIGTIDNPIFLPMLGKLIDAIGNPQFVDDDFFGLRNSLTNALINCGKADSDATIAVIEEHRKDSDNNDRSIRFFNYVIEEIHRNKQKNGDQPRSLKETKTLLKLYS